MTERPRKKVLLATRPLVPPWDEASKNFAYSLAREMRNPDIEMHILTTREQLSDLGSRVIAHALYPAGKRHHGGAYPLVEKIRLPLYLALHSFRYDVIHYLFTPTRFNSFVINHFTPGRKKTIQTVATLRDDLYAPEDLRNLFFADRLVTYTDRTKEKLERLSFSNVKRIYPGIDVTEFRPGSRSEIAVKRYGFRPEDFIVMYPGEYTRLGATDFLAESLLAFFERHRDSRMKFFFACRTKNEADRQKRGELQKLFERKNISQHIVFEEDGLYPGPMTDLYNTADLVVFPVFDLKGKFDVPLVIIEAYACGKPVILSDLPDFVEFSNPDICVSIPKGSREKFLESLAYLSHDFEKRRLLGEAARRFVEANFDLKKTVREYEKLYKEI